MSGDEPDGAEPALRLEIDLAIEAPVWLDDLPRAEALSRRAAAAALERALAGSAPTRSTLLVALVLADDDRLRRLNRIWRGVDRTTDVLAFPSEERLPGRPPSAPVAAPAGAPVELGGIAIAHGTARRDALEAGRAFESHLSHLVVHGALHLLGYDHGTSAEARIMEGLEGDALATLGVADPYR